MSVPIISADVLRANVTFEELIEPVSLAFQQSSSGQADNGLIVMFPQKDRSLGDVYVKTGTVEGAPFYIVKVSPWFAENVNRSRPQGGFIAVFDGQTGHTVALLDEQHYLSDIRTAAAGALAARIFAPPIVRAASVLGSGVQAYWQVLALYHERPFEVLRIWARDPVKARSLASKLGPKLGDAVIEIDTDLERVVRTSDVLLTTTLSREPLVKGEWLHPGQHITAVGADDQTKCELDVTALHGARVFVDSTSTTADNGDVHRAIKSGGYLATDLAGEIGDVLAGRTSGRISDSDITIAKFVGIGAQDLAAACVAIRNLGIDSLRTELAKN
jgi:ornithine cyclodeaminase/alanine dehydrogenase-like protein (mu-crystallin family)